MKLCVKDFCDKAPEGEILSTSFSSKGNVFNFDFIDEKGGEKRKSISLTDGEIELMYASYERLLSKSKC